jgi:hypothetical protein
MFVGKNVNGGGTYGGVWWSMSLARGMESGSRCRVGAFGGNLAPVVVIFLLLIYFIKKFYKCCSFNDICEGNAEIKCTTVRYHKLSFQSTVTWGTLLNIATKLNAPRDTNNGPVHGSV